MTRPASQASETIALQIASLEQELLRLKRTLIGEVAPRTPISLPMEALVLEAAGFSLAVDIHEVVEVISMVWVEPLAGAPDGIRGAINFRGHLVPVLDFAVGLGHATSALHPDRFLAVIQAGSRSLALVADLIGGVQILTEEERDAAARTTTTLPAFVRGLFRRGSGSLLLIDPAQLLGAAELDLLTDLLSEASPDRGSRP